MSKKIVFFLMVVFVVLALYIPYKNSHFENTERLSVDSKTKRTVILTALGSKNRKGAWLGEVSPFMSELENSIDRSSQVPMCDRFFEGNMNQQPVFVVVSGPGKVKSTACLMEVLLKYDNQIKEVILSGIAGITPMRGGMVDDAGNLRNDERVMIGDVCINSIAYDFEAQYYTSDQGNTRGSNPIFWASDSHDVSKQIQGSVSLSEELSNAGAMVDWPESSSEVTNNNIKYHGVIIDYGSDFIKNEVALCNPDKLLTYLGSKKCKSGGHTSVWYDATKNKEEDVILPL